MEKITKYFLNNKILVHVIILSIFIFGIYSLTSINKEGFPEISFGNIIITTIYPGASAEDVEMNVTVPIEEALNGFTGIQEITSSSNEGISIIKITADENYNDSEFLTLYQQIDSELSKIDDFPDAIEGRPTLEKLTSLDMPFIEIAFSGKYEELLNIIPPVKEDLLGFKDIAVVEEIGLPDREVHIVVDHEKAKKNYVGLRSIANSIQNRNLEGSGGTLESFIGEKKIVSINKFENPYDVLDVNIRTSQDAASYGVKVKDVADIKFSKKNEKLLVRNNGKRGASLILKKKKGGNIIEASNEVHEYVSKLNLPDNISVKIINDQSRLTKDRLSLTINNAVIGFVLVVAILIIVFDINTAIWVAFGIPFSLMVVFIVLYKNNMSINAVTLGGFIVVLGMLVDDAIVISENYMHNLENGSSSFNAALNSIKTMWKPVLAACSTTAVAFSPILFFKGLPGKFTWSIPFVVLVSLTASLIESYFFMPVHLSHSLFKQKKTITKKSFIKTFENIYKNILKFSIKYRYLILLVFFLLFIFTIFTAKNMKKDSFPQDAAEAFTVSVEYPAGFTLNQSESEIIKIEEIISNLPKNELIGFSSRIGTNSTSSLTKRGTQDNVAIIFVYLTPFSSRDRNIYDIIKELRIKTKSKSYYNPSFELVRIGIPFGWPLEIKVLSNNEETRNKTVTDIKHFLKTYKYISKIEDDVIEGTPEIDIKPDYNILSRTGLSVKDILSVLRIAFDGIIVTDQRTLNGTIDYRVKIKESDIDEIETIKDLPIMNSNGKLINLGSLLTFHDKNGVGEITHYNKTRCTTVKLDFDKNKLSGNQLIRDIRNSFPNNSNYKIMFDGEIKDSNIIFADVGKAAIIALLTVFLIITVIFNSFKKPFIIILSLPLAIPGVILSTKIHGLPISLFTGLALIGLVGIVVNDSIVLVHSINNETFVSRKELINNIVETSSKRLRPVILTTLTTVLGLFPTGYAIGGYDPFLSAMCIGLAYGLLYGTVITLIIVPIYYIIGNDLRFILKKFQH